MVKLSGEQAKMKKEENLGDLTQVLIGTWPWILLIFPFLVLSVSIFN